MMKAAVLVGILAGASAQDCASTDAGCSAYSLIETGTCADTAGCTAIVEEDACRELHTLVDIVLCAKHPLHASVRLPPLSSRFC